MHPNFALHRLVDCVRPDLDEIQLARDRFAGMKRKLAQAFPRARFVPIGSHSRGTAIAVHSHVDFLAVLPTEWARWGGRRVAPLTIIDRINDNVGYLQLALAPKVRRDDRGAELHFHGATFPVDVIPGFILRLSDRFPVYSLPGEKQPLDRGESRTAKRVVRHFQRCVRRKTAGALSANQSLAICPLPSSPTLELVCRHAPYHLGLRNGRQILRPVYERFL